MNKDSDSFFKTRKSLASHVYSEIAVSFGSSSGWIPDLVEIVVVESGNLTLRLIELEAKESEALISSKKYLPENSEKIIGSFEEYIEKVIRDCRSRADSREDEFVRIKAMLSKAEKFFVASVGALRSSSVFTKELSLIDQPNGFVQNQSVEEPLNEEVPNFAGTLRLSTDKTVALSRAIPILDAAICQHDHGDATSKIWRAQDRSQPLKKLLKQSGKAFSCLRAFISVKRFSGTTLDFDKLVSELVEIWSGSGNSQMDRERVCILINRYFPVAVKISPNDRMPAIFDEARKSLTVAAI